MNNIESNNIYELNLIFKQSISKLIIEHRGFVTNSIESFWNWIQISIKDINIAIFYFDYIWQKIKNKLGIQLYYW